MPDVGRPDQLGAEAPHALLRSLRCTDGEIEFESEYAPRPEYGLIHPRETYQHM